ncbi:hypothetical protein J0W91_19230, partial [Clostridioides difficile]|nr:hypothetical protein [Clostridioides difficile]
GVFLFKYNLIDSLFTTKSEIKVKPRRQALTCAGNLIPRCYQLNRKVEKSDGEMTWKIKKKGKKKSKTDAKARLSF